MEKLSLTLVFSVSMALSIQAQKYDVKTGAETAKIVELQMGVVENQKTNDLVTGIGMKLVDQLENPQFEYQFFIVDMLEPNAFSLPGGYIYVSRGLLSLINSEDELAGILGHEVMHSHNRHSYKQMKRNILPSVLKLPGAVVGAVNEDVGALINAPIGAVTGLTMAKYSRKHEFEADEHGSKLAAKAGYDPLALGSALQNIVRSVESLTGQELKFSYFDDHPFTPDRIKKLEELAVGYKIGSSSPLTQSKRDLYDRLSGIYVGQNPKQGVFKQNRFYHPDLDFGLTFPEGWKATNNPQYVGASQEEGQARILLGVVGTGGDPEELAIAFVTKLKQKYPIEAYRFESLSVDGYKAHIFAIDEVGGREVVNTFMFWCLKGNITYKVIATGYKKYEKDFEATVRSFHSLSSDEKAQISGLVLRTAMAQEGETLEEVGSREANKLNTMFTAVMNALPEDITFKKAQPLKIAKQEAYISNN